MKKWSRNNTGPKTFQELRRFKFTLVNANIPEKGVFAIFNSRRISFLARKQKHETVYQIRRIIYLENMSQIQGKLLNFDKISQRQDLTFIDDENDFEIQ